MTSFAKRTEDDLLSPENSVLTVIDYQPTQINSINSMNHSELIRNAEIVIRLANLYQVPIVLSTVNVKKGWDADTIPVLKKQLVQMYLLMIEPLSTRGKMQNIRRR